MKLFYSYAHTDEEFVKKLINHLKPLEINGLIDGWFDRKIIVGQEIDKVIDENLDKSKIILFIVSSDFIASKYCQDIEVAKALQKHENGEAKVIPVILRKCRWYSMAFGKLLATPKDGKPVVSNEWHNIDDAFTDIVEDIERAVNELNNTEKNSQELVKALSDDESTLKLFEIFLKEQQRISDDSDKSQIQNLERIRHELSKKLLDGIDVKQYTSKKYATQRNDILCQNIFSSEKIDRFIISEITQIRNEGSSLWHKKVCIISALTLSLLYHKQFDSKKAHILIDFITDFEEMVWQHALVGLTISLIKNINKWQRYNDIRNRISLLQGNEDVQRGLSTIESILCKQLYRQSIFFKNVYELDFFRSNMFNCFMPFYKDNDAALDLINRAPNTFDADTFLANIYTDEVSDPVKYYCTFMEDFNQKKNEAPLHVRYFILNQLKIGNSFQPYYRIITNYYNFYRHYPHNTLDDIFDKEISLASSRKLASVILSKVNELVILGDYFKINKKYSEAISYYSKALNLSNDNLHALNAISSCYSSLGKYSEVISYRKKILKLYPENRDNLIALAAAYHHSDKNDEALIYFLEVKEKYPNHVDNLVGLAFCYFNLGRIDDCIATSNTIQGLANFSSSELTKFADILSLLGDDNKAITYRLRADEINPSNVDNLYDLVVEYLYIGENEKAESIYKKTEANHGDVENSRNNAIAHINLILYKDLDTAAKYFKRLHKKKGYTLYCNLAHIELIRGNREKAIELYLKGLKHAKNKDVFRIRFEKEIVVYKAHGLTENDFGEIIKSIFG